MESSIHYQILGSVFAIAVIMGAVANKTNFCTMGAVSDWVNMGDSGRFRSWLLAIAVAMAGVLALEATGTVNLNAGTFPPYRTENFAWLRYLLGGLMFGVGMTLGSGCGNKTLIRVGGGNLKSLVVLAIASVCAYLMLWTELFDKGFNSWIAPTSVSLAKYGIRNQELSTIIGGAVGVSASPGFHLAVGAVFVGALLVYVFKSKDFRESFDNLLGGSVVGLAVVAGWYITGGPMGQAWKDWAEMATDVPSRVAVQSYTFISPMGDTVRYLMSPTTLTFINFGVMALAGVIFGSFLYAVFTRRFRIEWFANGKDFVNHAAGGVLMGVGGVLSMGCTIGQGVTGFSTLALGSILAFLSILIGSAATMKYQYWRMMQEA
ncbi:MAG: YeeE/YedE family protein [Betaproteobacteria bacterium]|nr:YeeE/YedE family protein [Betaproteobacteria bacterium]